MNQRRRIQNGSTFAIEHGVDNLHHEMEPQGLGVVKARNGHDLYAVQLQETLEPKTKQADESTESVVVAPMSRSLKMLQRSSSALMSERNEEFSPQNIQRDVTLQCGITYAFKRKCCTTAKVYGSQGN